MRNSRLGCLTPAGIIAALATVFFIAGYAASRGGVLYSPGPLNAQAGEAIGGVTSHAGTGGNCKACHVSPFGALTMADRCVACHTNVAVDMREVATLHGSINRKNPNLQCGYCHPDHRGPDAPLTIVTSLDFPHEDLGFSLLGHPQKVTGEAFACSDCHAQSVSTFDPLDCQTCHQQMDAAFAQAHAINYGLDCLACHDGVDRFGKLFTHAPFQFRLDGKHAQAACVSCHTNARALTDFVSAPQDCFSCHQQNDAHQSRFGADCAACHSTEAWTPATFDHDLAAFKLKGGHREVACEDCHKNGVFQGAPSDCYSCHAQNDEHGGRFGSDCGSCHTPEDWERVTFDHSKSNFPLTGAHINVACEKCHSNGQFAGAPSSCVSCHSDPVFHAGAFGTQCESCHNAIAWSPAKYNGPHPAIADEGGYGVNHGGTTCKGCHTVDIYSYTCLKCHSNNFGGESGGED